MLIDRWIRKLLPRTEKFLGLFIADVENLMEACRALRELFDAPDEAARLRKVREIEELEHKGDEYTHTIFRELGMTFITTLDREDIGTLASALDDILDHIDRTATAIHLYRVSEFDPPMRELAEIIEESVVELKRAIPLLRDLQDVEHIRESILRINTFENQADDIFHAAIGRLFEQEKDPIQLIKKKDLLAMLESATDRCEDAAVLMENVLVKQG
jgi:uncharacterized protein Yka (UPF0111/DUF47 family)